jgi:hypothetical protein
MKLILRYKLFIIPALIVAIGAIPFIEMLFNGCSNPIDPFINDTRQACATQPVAILLLPGLYFPIQ